MVVSWVFAQTLRVITDDKDRIAILKELKDSDRLEVDDPEGSLKQIDMMFTHGIRPDDLPEYFEEGQEDQCRALQSVFRGYMNGLIDGNQLDFGSMLYLMRELLDSKPRIARQVRTVYRYVCVDEFQDTNLAQYKILRLLCPNPASNLFIVADDDQIIFQWNGADPKRLKELKRDYSPEIVQLPENYRCPAEVVEIANRLIAHNCERICIKRQSIARKSGTSSIKLKSFSNFNMEIQGLISEIGTIPKNQRATCLVIARSNKLLAQVKAAMVTEGMNAEIVHRNQHFTSPPVQFIYYAMKLANAPESRSLLNKLCAATGHIDGDTLSAEDVAAKARVEGTTPLRAFFSQIADRTTLKSLASSGIKLLCDDLDYSVFAREAFKVFDTLNDAEGTEVFPDYVDDKASWEQIAGQICHTYGINVSLYLFLQKMDLSPKVKSLSRSCVRLQTVHTAKGMEFDHVFVVGLAEDQFPTHFAIRNGESAIQEERRNCFVAVTLSSRRLYLSHAQQYFGWSKQPSRFLIEMGLISG